MKTCSLLILLPLLAIFAQSLQAMEESESDTLRQSLVTLTKQLQKFEHAQANGPDLGTLPGTQAELKKLSELLGRLLTASENTDKEQQTTITTGYVEITPKLPMNLSHLTLEIANLTDSNTHLVSASLQDQQKRILSQPKILVEKNKTGKISIEDGKGEQFAISVIIKDRAKEKGSHEGK